MISLIVVFVANTDAQVMLWMCWKWFSDSVCVCCYENMFSLLYGLFRYLFQREEYFVLILGLDNAGKTTFLEQSKTKLNDHYRGVPLNKITATVGLNIGRIHTNGIVLNFWDLGGQTELQTLWDKYFLESHAVIYVVDSSDKERLEDSKQAFGLSWIVFICLHI